MENAPESNVIVTIKECLHEISFRAKRNIFNSVSGQSLTTVYMKYTELKNSRQEVFCKKEVLRNFAKFTGKHLCQSGLLYFAKYFACEIFLRNISQLAA